MITCGVNVKKGRVKKRMLMALYHHREALMRISLKNSGKNCLVTAKMRKKTILKVFRCHLAVVENVNQKKFFCFF